MIVQQHSEASKSRFTDYERKIPPWEFRECYDDLITFTEKGQKCFSPIGPSTSQSKTAVVVAIQRPVLYDEKLSWHWHKSWNVPNITVNVDSNAFSEKRIYAQVFAVKMKKDENGKQNLMDIGLKGISKKDLTKNAACFTALKFITTSYYHEDNRFYLLVCVFESTETGEPQLLKSLISPSIYVDSRKMARETHESKKRKVESTSNSFSPDLIHTKYFKRVNKNREMVEIPILNNFQGLYDYFTAPNIRHKVRHPIFLAIKFSNCVKFYYNSKAFPVPNLREILGTLQLAFDVRGKEVVDPQKLHNLAILQIILPDPSYLESGKKVVDGIGVPDAPYTPLKISLNTEPIQPGYVLEELLNAAKETFGSIESTYSRGSSRSSRLYDDSSVESNSRNRSRVHSFASKESLDLRSSSPEREIVAQGFFPQVKYPTSYNEESRNTIQELLQKLSTLSGTEEPLKGALPLPFPITPFKTEATPKSAFTPRENFERYSTTRLLEEYKD